MRPAPTVGSRSTTILVAITLLVVFAGGLTIGVVGGETVETGNVVIDDRADSDQQRALVDTSQDITRERTGATVSDTRSVTSSDSSDAGSELRIQSDNAVYRSTSSDILVTNALSLTDTHGTVGVTTTATVPDGLAELRITLRSAADGEVETDGFTYVEDDENGHPVVEWDGTTVQPAVTYRMDANVTADPEGPLAETGAYRFVDAGDWAIVQTPVLGLSWRGPPGTGVSRENVVDGPGIAGEAMAFLGAHTEYVHETSSQQFRLIVPDAANLEESPDRIFAAFEYASNALQVGARDETVIAIAAPTGTVDWGVRGLQTGDAELWVLDDEPAETADDVWTHEYVHTRQSYTADSTAVWFTEAAAMHYAALFALERGDADFEDFQRSLARGEREPDASAVLADPETWDGPADYTKGALVAGEIDRQLRVATDGESSLATVFRDLNEAAEPITNELFLDAVEAAVADRAADDEATAVRADAERYTTTAAVPDVWDRADHEAAFGETPAQVGYGLATDGVRATGEYRDRPIASDPARLVSDETLSLALTVRNTGGVAGDYTLTLTVDGEDIETQTGTIDADETRTATFEYAFDEPGEYEVRVGGETMAVVVTDPAPIVVRDVAVDPTTIGADGTVGVGDAVTVTARLGNDADIPAGSDVEIQVDGGTIERELVRLDVGSETRFEREVVLKSAGQTTVTVSTSGSEASTTIDVADDSVLDQPDENGSIGDTVGDVPGFGVVAALLALSCIALLGRGRR